MRAGAREGGRTPPTKEELSRLRQQGMTNGEAARELGLPKAAIDRLYSKYRIPRRKGVTQEKIREMVRLKKAGKSLRQIAEVTGYSVGAARDCLAAEGLLEPRGKGEGCFRLPEGIAIVPPAVPRTYRVCYSERIGGRLCRKGYIDVSEGYMPH